MIKNINLFIKLNKIGGNRFSGLYFKSSKKQKKYLQKNNFQTKIPEIIEKTHNSNSQNFLEFSENLNVSDFSNSFSQFKKLKHLLENKKLKKSYRKLYTKEKQNLLEDIKFENLEDLKIPFVYEKNKIINFEEISKNLKKEFLEDIKENNILEIAENKILNFFENINNNKIEKTKSNFEKFFFTNFKNTFKLLNEMGLKIKFKYKKENFLKTEFLGNKNFFLINCDINRKKNLPKVLYIEKNEKIDEIDFILIKKKKLEKNPKSKILSRHFIKLNIKYDLQILDKENKIIFEKNENFDKDHFLVCENLISSFDYRKYRKNISDILFFEKFGKSSSYKDLYFIDYDFAMEGNDFYKTFKI